MARSGLCVPASIAPRSPARRLDHAVAVGAERGAQEAPDFRLVLDHQDRRSAARSFRRHLWRGLERQGEAERRALREDARPRCRPPCRSHDRAADGETQAHPADGSSRCCRGRTWRTAPRDRPAAAPGRSPRSRCGSHAASMSAARRIGVPGGVYLEAFSSKLTRTCSISTRRSARAAGPAAARPEPDVRRAAPAGERSTEPTTSLSECQSRLRTIAPPSRRVIWSTLATRSLICCDCWKMLRASALLSARSSLSPRSTRLDEGGDVESKALARVFSSSRSRISGLVGGCCQWRAWRRGAWS